MDLLKKFDTQASYDVIKDSLEYPTVSYVRENDLVYLMQPSLYEWVDLGLPSGLKWATCNVGATKPEEYGLYFAWGETQGYTGITNTKKFTWSDYKFSIDGSSSNFSKYNSTDGLTTLEQVDDAAYASDKTCRMPTDAELRELENYNYITTTVKTLNGVKGVRFTSKTNGNSIFIPAAGTFVNGKADGINYSGYLWGNCLWYDTYTGYSYFFIGADSPDFDSGRYIGMPIRAVLDK